MKPSEQCVWVDGLVQCSERAEWSIAGKGAFGLFDPESTPERSVGYGYPSGLASHCRRHAEDAVAHMNAQQSGSTYHVVPGRKDER